MRVHLSIAYQIIVVAVGISASAVSIRRARRSGRGDHLRFFLFWLSFTVVLLVGIIGDYLHANVDTLTPVGGMLIEAIHLYMNYLMIALVALYLHALGNVPAKRFRDGVFLFLVFVSVIATSPPWGVGLQPDSWEIQFRAGYWVGAVYYLGGLAYASVLAWRNVWKRPGTDTRAFLVGMAVFATAGLIESTVYGITTLRAGTVLMQAGSAVYSTIPYLVYGIFMVVYGRIEDAPGSNAAPAPDAVGETFPSAADRFGLSEREREVVELLQAGHSNQMIADELFISLATVKTHLYRIYRKAGVPSRLGLVQALQRTA